MSRIARGTMTYTYEFDNDNMFMQQLGIMGEGDDEAIRRYFVAQMVEDIIHNAYGDLAPCIEMEII